MTKKPVNKTKADVLYAYKSVFSSPEGQLVLKDLQAANHVFSSTAYLGKDEKVDPVQMAMAEGERNVVLRIMTIVESEN